MYSVHESKSFDWQYNATTALTGISITAVSRSNSHYCEGTESSLALYGEGTE